MNPVATLCPSLYNRSYTVYTCSNDWHITPDSIALGTFTTDQSGLDFVAYCPTVTGRVTDAAGLGVEGVTFNVSPYDYFYYCYCSQTTTDPNGYYRFGLWSGFSGTVTPVKQDWGFDPNVATLNNLTLTYATLISPA